MDIQNIKDIKTQLDQIQNYVDDSLFDLAERKFKDLDNQIQIDQNSSQQLKQHINQYNSLKKIIKQTIENMQFQLDEMNNINDWETNKINDNFLISFKIFQQTNTVSIKAEAELDIPWFNLVALVYEVDLFTEWFPFCKQAYTIDKPRKAQKIAYFEMRLPFIHNREAYLEGIGIDRLDENGTILIKCKSLQEDEEFLNKYKIDLSKSKNVQVDVNFFACEIQPLNDKKVKVKTISNVNPKVNFIPKWMLNFFCKKLGKYLIEKMLNLAKDIKGTKWEQAINDPKNAEFYNWVKKRIDNYNQKIKQKK